MNQHLEAALSYARRGWSVFPLHGVVRGRCTCGRTDCASPGKHPLTRHGLHDASPDPDVVRGWWRRWRGANVGVATGSRSRIVVVDIDLPAAFASIGHVERRLPRTLTAFTGGGGIHFVYASNDGNLRNSASRLPGIDRELPGVDLRANGGYVVAPPSIHLSGSRYAWLHSDAAVAPAPEWLKQPERPSATRQLLAPADFDGDGTAYGLAVLHGELDRLRAAPIGTRNHDLNRAAFAIARVVAGGELLEDAARAALLVAALHVGLTEHESMLTITSAFRAGRNRPRCAPHRTGGP